MQANEPTSDEYDSIYSDAHKIVSEISGYIIPFTKYTQRMYEYSEVDNSFLADALENMTRSLVNLGSDAERVRLHAIACTTEAKLREEEAKQKVEEADGERPE